MSHVVRRLVRGTTAKLNAYAGPAGELCMDTQTNELVLQNGAKGGVRIGGKLGTMTVGSKTQPVYFSNGLPVSCDSVASMVADAVAAAVSGTSADDKELKDAVSQLVSKALNDALSGTSATQKALKDAVEKMVTAAIQNALSGTAASDKALKDAVANLVAKIFSDSLKNENDPVNKALQKSMTELITSVLNATIEGTDAAYEGLRDSLITLITSSVQGDPVLANTLKATLGVPIVLTADMNLYVDPENGTNTPTFAEAIAAKLITEKDIPAGKTTDAAIPDTYMATVKWGSKKEAAFGTISAAVGYVTKWYNIGARDVTINLAGGQYSGGQVFGAPTRTTGSITLKPYSTVTTAASTKTADDNKFTRTETITYNGTTATTTTFEDVRIVQVMTNDSVVNFSANATYTMSHIAFIALYCPPTGSGNQYPNIIGFSANSSVGFYTCEFYALSAYIHRLSGGEGWIDTRGLNVNGTIGFYNHCRFIGAFVDIFNMATLESTVDASKKFFKGVVATKAKLPAISDSDVGDICLVKADETHDGEPFYYIHSSSNTWNALGYQPSNRDHVCFYLNSGAKVAFHDSNTKLAPRTLFYGNFWHRMIYSDGALVRHTGGLSYAPKLLAPVMVDPGEGSTVPYYPLDPITLEHISVTRYHRDRTKANTSDKVKVTIAIAADGSITVKDELNNNAKIPNQIGVRPFRCENSLVGTGGAVFKGFDTPIPGDVDGKKIILSKNSYSQLGLDGKLLNDMTYKEELGIN